MSESEMVTISIPEIFRYKLQPNPEHCIHVIRPSQINAFFAYPKEYYMENIAGADPTFQGNTATTIGTICHHVYDSVTKGIDIDRESINTQLDEFNRLKPELELDITGIKTDWPKIVNIVVPEYLIPANSSGAVIKSEYQISCKIDDGIYLQGTLDRLEGDCVVDFKTVGKMPSSTDTLPFNYRMQLLAYAYALRKAGHIVDRIRIVYGIRPTKTIGARWVAVTETIGYAEEKLIEDTLRLIAESVTICKNKPELTHIIFKSYDLKQ